MHKLTIDELPKHTHASIPTICDDGIGVPGSGDRNWRYPVYGPQHVNPSSFTGNDLPHNIMMPYIALHYIIKI